MPLTNVLVWSDGTVRKRYPDGMDPTLRDRIAQFEDFLEDAAENYPNGVNAAIAEHLNEREEFVAHAVSLTDPGQGITRASLEWADAVVWWGHLGQVALTEETVERIERRVREDGLGLVVLHSANNYRPFTGLLGTSGEVGDFGHGESERVTVRAPDHPIARGVEAFTLPEVEWYDEPFDVPEPETVVFESSFSGGATLRSGVTFSAGQGRVFYFRPGDEQWRTYHDPSVRRILANAAEWAAGGDGSGGE